MDLLCHCRRKHSGICSRIGDQLLLIKLLHNAQRLIRTDLEHFGTFILKLRQVKQKRRILFLFFLFNGYDPARTRLFQLSNTRISSSAVFFLFKSIFLVELRRLKIIWNLPLLSTRLQTAVRLSIYDADAHGKTASSQIHGSPVPCGQPCQAHRSSHVRRK